ncbi:MAG: ABC transporter permease [Clostridiaceae bacterium]|nr:ABC transporter permease [Clostridiaceae bacterium]
MRYISKRLLTGVLLVLCVSFLVFSMLYLMPGDPVTLMAGETASPEKIAEISKQYGLDRPLLVQYADWLKGIILHQDFGISFKYKLPVWDLVKVRVPISLRLTVITMIIEYVVAVPLGLLCAYKKDTFFDRFTVNMTLVMISVPSFWIAAILILVFSVKLGWFPLSGFNSWKNYVLPIATGVLGGLASTLRLTKSEAVDALGEKYVTTAYAKGLSKTDVMFRHVLRNSLIIICVQLFQSLPWLISGYIIIEKVFAIPGMGGLMISSIVYQDFNVVQCIIFLISIMTVVCNIIADIVLGMLDPRIRISTGGGEK